MKIQEIKERARDLYGVRAVFQSNYSNLEALGKQQSFVEGAIWALGNQWIDVYDRFPDHLQDVIAFFDTTIEVCTFDDDFYTTHDVKIPFVKYWMAIPELPKS